MHVAEIWRYPVKSMGGEKLDAAEIDIDGIPGDRTLYVVDARGEILSARTKPGLLGHHATATGDGEVLVDGQPWASPEVAEAVEKAAGPGARIVEATGAERFDILPLLVATDGAIAAFGYDSRRLRPNVILADVDRLAERTWEGRQLDVGEAVIVCATLRGRCIMTTFDPDSLAQDVNVLRHINDNFNGTMALNCWAGVSGRVAVGDAAVLMAEPVEVARPALGRYA